MNASHLLLSDDEVNGFRVDGPLLQERVFSAEEVARLKQSAEVELASAEQDLNHAPPPVACRARQSSDCLPSASWRVRPSHLTVSPGPPARS